MSEHQTASSRRFVRWAVLASALVMALFAFSGALTLLGVLISDLLYMIADPRISLTGRRE